MKIRRYLLAAVCTVLSVCTLVYSAEYDQNGQLSLLKGDLNRDGVFDIADALLFTSAWLEQGCSLSNPCAGADIYPECGDGVINFWDYGVLAGACGSCTDPCDPCCTNVALTLYEPPSVGGTFQAEIVSLFSGEVYKSEVDMRIPGSGIDFVFARTYRSRTGKNTSMGNNWSHSYDLYIKACSGNIILHDPTGRRDIYYAQPDGKWAARGIFRVLAQNPDGSFTMVFPDKGKWNFNPFDDPSASGKINAIVDRNGNKMSFDYDAFGKLVIIHTALDDVSHNRDITIAYNSDGLVESVTDYTGRQVKYEYYGDGDSKGSVGDLKSVTTPPVTDFPAGKKTVYTYTKGSADERRNHNLLTVTDPNGDTYSKYTYFGTQNPNDRDFDRVKRQILGEPNDIIDIRYRQWVPRPGNNYAVIVAVVNDRVGHVRHHWYDKYNRLVVLREYTGIAPDPDQFTDLSHNRPVGKLRPYDPDFFETRLKYNQDHLPVRVKYSNGNYKVNVYQGDLEPNAPPRSRGNLREIHHFAGPLAPVSDQNEIKAIFFYDTDSDPCGFNVIVRSVNPRGNERLYDYDDRGNLTRTTYKIPGPKPDIDVDYTYDTHGRLTSKVHPDNGSGYRRLDEYKYYNDPNDPNYGYLKNVIIDKNNHALTTTYAYDPFGNAIRVTDPNGNDMQLIRNQYGQVVKQISRQVSSGIRYETDFHYDIKDNVVHVARQNKDEEGTLQANSFFDVFVEIDILNNPTRVTREVDLNRSISTECEYDDNYNRTLTRYGEATNGNQPNNTVRIKRDERNLVFQITRAEGDPCQSTTQYDYDGNGNLKKVIRGLEGVPRITTHLHDGFNRRIETHDAMGNVSKFSYDEAGNLVSARRYGELLDVEGSAGNVRLFESKYRYDDLNRLFDTEILFFDPNTQMPIGDGNSVKQLFYSDNGLLTRTIDDNGNPTRYVYDTAGRLSTTIDAKYNRRIYQYDKNSDVIRLTEIDKVDVTDTNETFITNFERDGLGRLIKRIDSVGNITKYAYNSRNLCTLVTDALNNQNRREFDGVGRLIRTIRDMDGDGADPNDANDIVTQYAYDDSGRRISITDDNANTTIYKYDALNRMTDILFADGTERKVGYDVLDNPVQTYDNDGDLDILIYDKNGRLTRKNIIPGPETAHTTTFGDFNYDGLSRLVYARNDSSIVTFKHDSHSNLVEESLNGQTTGYTNDGMGNRLSVQYPGGRVINYIPDELNRTLILGDGLGNDLVVNNYVGRRLAQADYRNGTRTIYQYDGMKEKLNPPGDFGVKQIIKTMHVRVADGNQIDVRTYKWDPVGNKKQQKDIRLGGPRLTHDYDYDPARRLIQTTVTDGNSIVVGQTTYDLDGVGNRREVIGSPDTSPWVGSYIMDPTLPEPGDFQMNQYTSTPSDSRQYDLNGNLSIVDNDDPGFNSIKYDYRNRMVEYTDGTTGQRHTYSYDVLGRRTGKVIDADGIDDGPLETWYLYSGRQVVEEQNPAGATQATYVNGVSSYILDDTKGSEIIRNSITLESSAEELFPLSPISMHRDDQDYYYHRDDIGSVTAVTDSTDKIVERYRYADYGSPTIFSQGGAVQEGSTIGNSLMFAGCRYDQETGLYSIYFDRSLNLTLDTTTWTKSYDPQAGRFIQRHGGDALGNHYTAFGNNPGRGQALSISDWDTWFELNRPSSPGYVDKACTPFAAGGPKLDFAINGNSHGTYEMAQSGSLFSGIARGILIGAEGGSPFADTGLDILISPGIASFDDDSEKVWGGIMAAGGTSQTSHFDQAQQTIAKLIRGQSPISSYDTSGDAINAIIRGQSPISSITIRANRLTILGLSTLAELDPDSDVTLLLTTGGQSLSGSRGDDVWLFGGGTGILGPRINSYWQGLGLLRPKPESFVGAFGDADNIWWGWDDVWLFGGGADIDIGGFYFHPVLNFTDFILGDGF